MMKNNVCMARKQLHFKNSPHPKFPYLWVQLDQNVRALDSDSYKVQTRVILEPKRKRKSPSRESIPLSTLKNFYRDFDGGFKIEHVKDGLNRDIPYIINKTMMRVDVPEPIRSGQSYKFKIKWWYNINDHIKDGEDLDMSILRENDNYI
ncbi:MAG: hypothetical protein Ct9H90mP15_03790 [Candidatus Neomarinimicrobiota bacterium]|nr:MAG: hypothetical protein Ct9H90mP15_03790 [Candidatus Neomarinimicrobiota bacterium]